MNDLISRQAAIDALSMMQGIVAENGVRKGISLAWQQIKDLPSAQPGIVRCKECKYGEQDDDGWWYCRDTGYSMGDGEKGDGFCSNAERRTDG